MKSYKDEGVAGSDSRENQVADSWLGGSVNKILAACG